MNLDILKILFGPVVIGVLGLLAKWADVRYRKPVERVQMLAAEAQTKASEAAAELARAQMNQATLNTVSETITILRGELATAHVDVIDSRADTVRQTAEILVLKNQVEQYAREVALLKAAVTQHMEEEARLTAEIVALHNKVRELEKRVAELTESLRVSTEQNSILLQKLKGPANPDNPTVEDVNASSKSATTAESTAETTAKDVKEQ